MSAQLTKCIFLCFAYVNMPLCFASSVTFRSATSTIQVANGARFVVGHPLHAGSGKIIRDAGGTIAGADVIFDDGSFHDAQNRFGITGSYRPDGAQQKVILGGNKTFRGQAGTCIDEIYISGKDNRLEGDLIFGKDIVLQDANTSVTWAGLRRVNKNICMNGGTLFLEEDMSFIDDKRLVGSGILQCSRHKLIMGSQEVAWDTPFYFDHADDIELNSHMHLSQTWTFSGGTCAIFGNGNILTLEPGGNIVVERGSKVLFSGVRFENLAGTNIKCLDDAGLVIFQNVDWVQSGDFSFSKGSFEVIESCNMSGNHVFVYQSAMTSTIASHSMLGLSSDFTFSYDPIVPADQEGQLYQDLLVFQDVDSELYMAPNSKLFANDNGMQLKKGHLYVGGSATFLANPRIWYLRQGEIKDPNVGIIFGDGQQSENDFVCEFAPGAVINHNQGSFIYRNINPTSMRMHNPLSSLCIGAGATLMLNTSINMDFGRLRVSKNASMVRAPGTTITGAVEFFASE